MEEGCSSEDQLIVGLGNPGQRYQYTRHNAGALVLTALAHTLGFPFKEEKRFNGSVARGISAGKKVHLLLPATYMNNSGQSVRAYCDYFRLKPCDLIVVSDDVELPFGQLRLRIKGSAGGHNGLKSIESHLATQQYARLRIGVGKSLAGATLADYVLDCFNPAEMEQLPHLLDRGVEALRALFCHSLEEVANRFNVQG